MALIPLVPAIRASAFARDTSRCQVRIVVGRRRLDSFRVSNQYQRSSVKSLDIGFVVGVLSPCCEPGYKACRYFDQFDRLTLAGSQRNAAWHLVIA